MLLFAQWLKLTQKATFKNRTKIRFTEIIGLLFKTITQLQARIAKIGGV